MPAAAPGLVYDANDGGLDVSEDGGRKWNNRSEGLAITMFYDLDVAPSDGRFFGGGAQDNGTVITKTGDGVSVHSDLRRRRRLAGVRPERCKSSLLLVLQPGYSCVSRRAAQECLAAGDSRMSRIRFGCATSQSILLVRNVSSPDRIACGVLMTIAKRGASVSPKLDGSSITAIEVAPANSSHVYVGTENGGFFRSLNGGTKWSPNLSSSILPGHTITRLESHPTDENVVVATVANFGHSHVFRTRDGGRPGKTSTKDNFQMSHTTLRSFRQDDPKKIYVGNDAGSLYAG